jgi:hypothetical protein
VRTTRQFTAPPEETIRRLAELWDEGKSSGEPKPFDIERVISNAKSRFVELRRSS